ncbi:P27 family phage terminase small subunit [Priestia flexa]|jgi:phage terminase small subunit|uniref:P27 family phage terminase small subunit n=1 Tax=Priestia flexa TaxID=86664 RepID=UPI003D2A0929
MAVSITKLKQQLMSEIDIDDLVQVEKVERYIDLVKSFRKISKTIAKEGESVTTQNGSQKFTKAHPLIGERNKINSSLIALGKDIDSSRGNKQVGDVGNDYDKSDLV